ncbi:uncharacterized protein LOC142572961 [Dermacentor variabilis]|uniref:uncharacterized protein LOC142572961 n=1 Tax=Dermacentor variabilis TaxID=34621 RepID=UPI003F5C0282
MRAALNGTINEIGGGPYTARTTTATTEMVGMAWTSSTRPTPPRLGNALRPPKPTVSMDARPVLIPILSSVVCFPIVALAVICALRYRAQRLRRKERLRRLRGAGTRTERLDGMGRRGERPSFFSHDSSSGDASCWRPPDNVDELRRCSRPGASSSSSSGAYHFVDEITGERAPGRKKSLSASAGTAGSRRGSRVTFGAAAAAATVLQVPVVCERRPSSPRSAPSSSSPLSTSSQSPPHARSGSVSFAEEPSSVRDAANGYDADADDEEDADSPKYGTKEAAR